MIPLDHMLDHVQLLLPLGRRRSHRLRPQIQHPCSHNIINTHAPRALIGCQEERYMVRELTDALTSSAVHITHTHTPPGPASLRPPPRAPSGRGQPDGLQRLAEGGGAVRATCTAAEALSRPHTKRTVATCNGAPGQPAGALTRGQLVEERLGAGLSGVDRDGHRDRQAS